MTLKIGVMASGSGSNFQSILDAITSGELDAEVVMVLSNNSRAGALERARRANLSWRHLSSATHPDPVDLDRAIRDTMRDGGAEIICLAGYMKKIGDRTLAAFPGRILNIHPALLPKHGGPGCYGIHVHEKVLAAGDTMTGATVHIIDNQYDQGRILDQTTVPVEPNDTPETLQQRVLKQEHVLYPRVLRRIVSGTIRLTP